MTIVSRSFFLSALTLAMMQPLPSLSATGAEVDALNLESDMSVATEGTRDTKLFVEGAIGNASQRYKSSSVDTSRASIDFTHSARLASGWRGVISDRFDQIHPRDASLDESVNSLREAYVSWQSDDGGLIAEAGRINLRYGPSYGYNPTDFFRDGSLRVVTTADPFALRENRLGTAMLRVQSIWTGGSLSVAFAPKLADQPNQDTWSLDLGSTNNRDRVLVALGSQFSQRVSSQYFLYKQDGLSSALGANLTALLSDAAVAHLEWSRGRESDLLSGFTALPGSTSTRNRFAGGATYTTLSKLSLTAEYQYNGFAPDKPDWSAPGMGGVLAQQAYLGKSLRLQELASRQAYLVYVTQKGLLLKDLDLTAYLRVNVGDSSRLAWLELRHHWSKFDLTFQLQQSTGRTGSDFGDLPDRRTMQVLGTYFF
jgi:hypothetical protein